MKSSMISKAAYVAASLLVACSGGNSKGENDASPQVGVTRANATAVTLPPLASATFTAAVDVNDGNEVAGWATGPAGARGVSWAVAGAQVPAAAVEHLPITGNTHSAAYGIGSARHRVGESQKGTTSVAVAWLDGSPNPTELSLTGFSAPAVAFGSAGSRIVGQAVLGGRTVGVLWRTPVAVPEELRPLDSDATSRAYAISSDGRLVVGESTRSDGATRAVVWSLDVDGDPDNPEPLNPLAGDIKSVALGVNGEVIVGESEAANGSVRAVRWTRSPGGAISPPLEVGVGSLSDVSGQDVVGHNGNLATLVNLQDILNPVALAQAPSQALGINALGTIVGFEGSDAFVVPGEAPSPATGVTLTPSVASPQPAGTAVTFTAEGQGSTAPYQYRFWLYTAGRWQIVQDYGVGSSWTMPASAAAGRYSVSVHVRTSTDVSFDAVLNPALAYVITAQGPNPATGVTLTPSVASPQPAGTAVTFTAEGQGSTAPYQYRFWLYTGGRWEIVQDYGVGSTWTMPASTAAGRYSVSVHVRTSANVPYDAVLSPALPYVITGGNPATGVTLTPSVASPQPAGTAVTFSAEGQGSTAPYQYRFWLYTGGRWQIVQDYGVGSSWTMPPSTAAGRYSISVHVRTSTTVPYDAVLNPAMTYTLQ